MKITRQYLIIPVLTLLLGLSGCGDKNKHEETVKNTASTASNSTENDGNWKVKPDQLSTANATDIKSDLEQLNKVINLANSKSEELRSDLQNTVQNKKKVQEILAKTQKIQAETQQEILALNLKSAEVQAIRVQMLDNLATANQLQQLSEKSNFNLSSPSDEFKRLSQRSTAQQQKIGNELNKLNQKYVP